MEFNSIDNSILGSCSIRCSKELYVPISTIGEMFLKLVGTSSELKLISQMLDVEIVAVTKSPYGKRSVFFREQSTPYSDTFYVAYAMNRIENPSCRSTLSRLDDGSLMEEIPVYLNDECMAYILIGKFYLKEEENMIPDTAVINPRQLDIAGRNICQICDSMLESCFMYIEPQFEEIVYDSKMLFEYGSFFDYNLFTDTFILSRKSAELFGWDCNQTFKYADLVNCLVESDRQRITTFMRDKVMHGNQDYVFDTTIFRKSDGQYVSIEVSGTTIKGKNGLNIRTLGSITDVSMLKKTQEDLKSEIESKNRLIRIVGHDLKNPFNGLIGFSEILKANLSQQNYADALDIAEILRKCATEGHDLLVNLLDYSNSQSANLKAEKTEFDLCQTIESIIKLSSAQALKKGITVHNDVAENTMVYSDEYKVSTVLRNLVSNAIKFCFPKGVVIIEASLTGSGKMRISVSDTGEQLTAEKMEKINRCKDVESSMGTAHEKGTSIGLKLCHSFLRVLNSKLTAGSSDGITTFQFDIDC